MRILSHCISQGEGLSLAVRQEAPVLSLSWDSRQKSRFDAQTRDGERVGVILPRGQCLRGGDVLADSEGRLVRVEAAAQAVRRIEASSAFGLIRAAYHLGNRHVPIELRANYLQIEPDPVLEDMLAAMGLAVTPLQAPFEPESGAYGDQGHRHGHAHEHGHGH